MGLRFAAPWLLLVGLPLVLLVAWRLRSLPRAHAGPRRIVVQALILLALLAATFAVAGLEWGHRLDRMAVVFAIDRSRSVERSAEDGAARAFEEARAATDHMRDDDLAGVVVFGAEAATEVLPRTRPELTRSSASIARDGTDIGAAIRRALADLPAEHSGRIVLVSDGVETDGDALEAAQLAAGRGVTIDVLPVERAPSPEVAVERVQVQPSADPGEPIELRIVTRSTAETDVHVRVLRDGSPIADGDSRIAAGTDVLTLRDLAGEPGVHRYDAIVEPIDAASDGTPENNEAGAFLRVAGASRALVLSERPDEAEALADAIEASGLEVERGDAHLIPVDLPTLAGYDLLVLSDIDARSFTDDQLEAIRSYVRDLGGGLLMVGVRDSFGLGGYAYTPVEEVLPATFDLRRRRDRASLAMVIGIDKSGSMTVAVAPGVIKLDLANEGAARSALLLSPMDYIAVEHVDTAVTWTVPMQPVNDAESIAGRIRHAAPGGGGIYVDVAMEAAYEELRASDAQLRHFLLFSDGSDSEEMNNARRLVASALSDGITTSIVSMGNGPDSPELERLAGIGGGRFYIVDDMNELPRIFTQETIEASRSAVDEDAFAPILGAPSPVTDGIDWASAPTLGGHVVMNVRERATVLLGATAEDPLLCVWQSGVGRSAIFSTDVGASYATAWLAWPGYASLFGQLARHLARAPERSDAELHIAIRGGVGTVRVEAIDDRGRFRNYLDLGAVVSLPGGGSVAVDLAQTGSGRYEATFDASTPGPYLVTVRELDELGGGVLVGTAGLVRTRGDELRGEGTDLELLGRIATITGGEMRTTLTSVFTERPPPAWAYASLWRELVLAAMLLLLLSVAVRRLVVPRELLERIVPARLRAWMRFQAPRAAPVADATTLDALRSAKARATAGRDVAPEIAAARSATVTEAPPSPRREPEAAAPEPAPTPVAKPGSLAENLLERRKKKR